MTLAYLGPEGTFAEQAARLVVRDGEALVPFRDVSEVLRAVQDDHAVRAIVPIENALQGAVTATLDALAFETDLRIQAELDLPIDLVLAAPPGVALEAITAVHSHPVPLAGCRAWLTEHLADADRMSTSSTARAAQIVAETASQAAIVNTLAAERYGLEVLARDISDRRQNQTRFVVVGHGIPPRTGWDKTSLVAYIHTNRPGALLRLLEVFAEREVDLSKIESRPTMHELGDYCFFLDVIGHLADERVGEALAAVKRTQRDVKILGSYPRLTAPRDGAHAAVEADDASYRETRAWLRELRSQIRSGI